jgi:two-component system invasion response regulator UvrY
MIKVFIADDHAVVRRGVRQILEESADMAVVGEAATGREALRAVSEIACDVLLLDIALPDISGLEVLTQLRGLKPELQILILSVYPEKQYALRALKAGAAGYLTKDSLPEELLTAVRQAAGGGKYITQSLSEKMAGELQAGSAHKEPHELLSNREYQIVCLLAAGKTVSDIAAELSLSVKTVSTYRARILEKLGLQNTAEIIHYALSRGLIE